MVDRGKEILDRTASVMSAIKFIKIEVMGGGKRFFDYIWLWRKMNERSAIPGGFFGK